MKLLYIKIDSYKNLDNFSFTFSNTQTDLFVGKNGSGKSNFFEAIAEIILHIMGEKSSLDYNYTIKYQLDGREIQYSFDSNASKWKNNADDEIASIPSIDQPEYLLFYYSGHNQFFPNITENSNNKVKRNIRNTNTDFSRRFWGISKDNKKLLLYTILLLPSSNPARRIIIEKLGIQAIENKVSLKLKRPDYANNESYNIDPIDPETRYWKAKGKAKAYLDSICSVSYRATDETEVIDTGVMNNNTQFIHPFNLDTFQHTFQETAPLQIFEMLDALNTIGILEDIKFNLILNNDQQIATSNFSDGQYQTTYIYAMKLLFSKYNTISLLDEPDAFMHPEWQLKFFQDLNSITDNQTNNNHLLISSHSAASLVNYDGIKVNLFRVINEKVKCHPANRDFALKQLATNAFRLNTVDDVISMIYTCNRDKKPILFLEGSTDPRMIETAWSKLFDTEIPFIPMMTFTCDFLRRTIIDERVHGQLANLPIFALFDFDEAYNQWDSVIAKHDPRMHISEMDPYKGLMRQFSDQCYAFLLPVPDIQEIKDLVIKDHQTNETFKGNSLMSIEHLFYSEEHRDYFKTERIAGGGQKIKFIESMKTKFAEEVIPTLSNDKFEIFRPLLSKIKEIIQSHANESV
ncbi:AAA family ATPase [Halosquirtibacter xylanolyticus]|uniref:AAA family ATPase n=1 Tax=Halosquirtibacter xylanolyticus TaxID=3374599 RepID=UPI00374A874F|nr:AAA family ATPase [Prolixibacteraceae bacterium]